MAKRNETTQAESLRPSIIDATLIDEEIATSRDDHSRSRPAATAPNRLAASGVTTLLLKTQHGLSLDPHLARSPCE